MSNVLARRGRTHAYKIVMSQAVVVISISVILFALWGWNIGSSALVGGLIVVIPNFVFATLAFSYAGASASKKVVTTFFLGEAVKLLLTIVLFALALALLDVHFLALLATYVAGMFLPWLAPLYIKQN